MPVQYVPLKVAVPYILTTLAKRYVLEYVLEYVLRYVLRYLS